MEIEDENKQQTAAPTGAESLSKSQACTIVITDPPPGLDLGIDCMHYETGPNFRGFQQVPEGLHFIYHSTGMGSRQGFFLSTRKGEIIVLRWDAANEEISLDPGLPDGSLEALRLAVCEGRLDHQLGPYPFTQLHLWHNVSGLITTRVLERCNCPAGSLIFPGDAENPPAPGADTAVIPHFSSVARVARFVDIQTIDRSLQAAYRSASERTTYSLEKSPLIEKLVMEEYGGGYEDLLGELQLSFIMFLLLFSYPALEHWKCMVHTISLCENYLSTNPKFFCAFFRIFYEQLNFSPTDFFETELSRDNFLKPVLSNLLSSTEEITDATSHEHRKRFINFIRKKFSLFDENAAACFGGSLFDLMEEDFPVVVDNEESREHLPQFEIVREEKMSDNRIGPGSEEEKELSRHEIDVGLYCWRYPALFGAMQEGEDLEMAATRIIDDNQETLEEIERALVRKCAIASDDQTKMINEAYLFMRDEISPRATLSL